MRLFYALPTGEEDRSYLERWQACLAPRYRRAGRVYRENFHLTLRFLGGVDPMLLPRLEEALEELAGNHQPFTLLPDRPGRFSGRRGETVYLGFSRTPAPLTDVYRELAGLLEPLGYPVTTEPFVPHITLLRNARLREDGPGQEPDCPSLRQIMISRICLMESVSTPEGVRYREVVCGHLGGEVPQKSRRGRQE